MTPTLLIVVMLATGNVAVIGPGTPGPYRFESKAQCESMAEHIRKMQNVRDAECLEFTPEGAKK